MRSNQVKNILIPSMGPLKNTFSQIKQHMTDDQRINVDTFLFCTDVLVTKLTALAALVHEISQ